MASLQTALCRELGIEYPVFSVGFGMGAGPELVAAVSNTGGFGVLGGDGRSRELVLRDIERTRELTERPFGVNFVIPVLEQPDATEEDREDIWRRVEAAIAAQVSAIVLFWGDPTPFVESAHESGVRIFIQVGSAVEAKRAAEAGVDAVISQGVEAGGHVRGTTPIWELLPIVVEAVAPVPALASGGIGDGAGLARALELGAQGVSLGTRFVASEEAWIHTVHKRRVVESGAEDTVYSELYDAWWPGAPHRTLRNRTLDEWEAAGRPPSGRRPGEGTSIGTRRLLSGDVQEWPRYAVGLVPPSFEGDLERVPFLVGESCSVVDDVKPAAQIVKDLIQDAEVWFAETSSAGSYDPGDRIGRAAKDRALALGPEKILQAARADDLDRLGVEGKALGGAVRAFVEARDAASALELVGRAWRIWLSRGELEEGSAAIAAALEAPAATAVPIWRVRALYADGSLAFRARDQQRSRERNEEALRIAREAEDVRGECDALTGLARVALRDGRYGEVVALAEQARARARSADDREAGAAPLHLQAAGVRLQGDYAAARELYQESLALNTKLENEAWVAMEQHNLGWVELHLGNVDAAKARFRERDAGSGTDAYGDAWSELNWAAVAVACGDSGEARRRFASGSQALEALGATLDPDDQSEFDWLSEQLQMEG